MEGKEYMTVIDVYSEFRGKIGLTAVKTSVDILRIDACQVKLPFMFSVGRGCVIPNPWELSGPLKVFACPQKDPGTLEDRKSVQR